MLLLMFLACFGQKPKTISEKETIVISFAENLSTEQQRVAIIIENELKELNIAPNVIAAAIVNSLAESKLKENAIGDGGKSYGIFQLHINGLGHNLSIAERQNIRISSNVIGVQIIRSDSLYKSDKAGESIPKLSSIISEEIMRPKNTELEKETRKKLAMTIFPDRI